MYGYKYDIVVRGSIRRRRQRRIRERRRWVTNHHAHNRTTNPAPTASYTPLDKIV